MQHSRIFINDSIHHIIDKNLSGIRVTYSGLISLIGGLITVLTAIIFTLILTRTLATNEYGTWGLINGLLYYVLLIGPITSYWTTREIARGLESGTTAILSSGMLSIIGVIVYVIIAYAMGHQANIDQTTLFSASMLIPFIFIYGALNAINLGSKPQSVSYGSIFLGLAQILMGLVFVILLNMGVKGVILTLTVSYMICDVVLFIYARNKIRKKFDKDLLRKWIRFFWIPLYPSLTIVVAKLDIVIFTIMTGSVVGLAFWTAAMTLPSTISNAGLMSRAVYSKLLERDTREYVQDNITHLFYFIIPFTFISITFARPALFALNPNYAIAFPVAIFLAIYMFFNVLSNVFMSFLTGIEKVDTNQKSTFRDYIKSKLFFVPTLRLVQYAIYVILLVIGLSILMRFATQLVLLTYWSVVILVTEIPITIYLYTLVRKNFSLKMNSRSISKYFIAGIVAYGITYLLTEHLLHFQKNIFEFLPILLLFIVFGTIVYLLITYIIDRRTRTLFKEVIREIKNKMSN